MSSVEGRALVERRECPKVTVLMPVYNGARFLREAIGSILDQSFTDFEFLIIDDGSTDDSVDIAGSFGDPRICQIRNESNMGVARTLNRGIDLARGEFIARMDADDVSLPHRLEKQLGFFDGHPSTDVVATRVRLIDHDGQELGDWSDDVKTCTSGEIVRFLPRANCLAHPSIMMRTETARRYRYWESRQAAQDYHLWLRLAADHVRISKLDEVLVKHRNHAQSVTTTSNACGFGNKDIRVKARFLVDRFISKKRLNQFDLRVLRFIFIDIGKIVRIRLEKKLRFLVRKSLLALGKLCSFIAKVDTQVFFFFPYYHTGGAERVHANIVAAVTTLDPLVVFTHHSKGSQFKGHFKNSGRLLEPAPLLENVVGRIFCIGYFSSMINRSDGAKIFGSNTPFFYELLPYLESKVECFDLIHAFGGGIEKIGLSYHERLKRRIVINEKVLNDIEEQYVAEGVSKKELQKVSVIENAVLVPSGFQPKNREGRLKVLYVGRASCEKRVYLIEDIARRCHALGLPVDFTLVGDLFSSISEQGRECCTLTGAISDTKELEERYREHDVLIMTSLREGFPMAIMEAMAHGVVPISTDVGGISCHVIDGITGFLVPNAEIEDTIASSFVELLSRLADDGSTLEEMSERAYCHALKHFSLDRFNQQYSDLLIGTQIQGVG